MSQGRDATLPRFERQQFGVYYTPSELVRYVVDATWPSEAKNLAPAVLDPACGDGAFLVEWARRVSQLDASLPQLLHTLFGIDRDPEAVKAARTNVAREVLGSAATLSQVNRLAGKLVTNIVVADALLDPLPNDWPKAFDVIVGNPPYVNIRRLGQQDSDLVERFRQRFRCARGGFDLYVLFIERAVELLRSNGRCGLVVPNKLATLDYASACRTMLIEETRLELLSDVSDANHFRAANVYPQVLVFEKCTPHAGHCVRIVGESMRRTRLQSQLNVRGQFDLTGGFDVEARVSTRPLGELCRLQSGTTGFMAQQIAGELQERERAPANAFPFITSGNIDRYQITLGNVRYMQRSFSNPVLRCDSGAISKAKRDFFREPKIVLAGMSQRLEAAWCGVPTALGVQVFAAANISLDPFYLLAVLNSRLISHLFRLRFSAKRLGGGYLSINKGQLAQLPIVDPSALDQLNQKRVLRLRDLARKATYAFAPAQCEQEIDALVYQLYRLSKSEIEAVDQSFAGTSQRAA